MCRKSDSSIVVTINEMLPKINHNMEKYRTKYVMNVEEFGVVVMS